MDVSLEGIKSELSAVKEQISEAEGRIDRLKKQYRDWWEKRDRAEIQNQKEALAQADQKVEQIEKSLTRAKNAVKQLTARDESLTARIREAKQAEDGVPTQFALLSRLEQVRKLRRLSEIAEEE
ncbi:hypothetical protein [Salinibacter altiplanensis]|uniref:hypothetical protein n=1 Tax=Salinibacter altiplanensis TaxID=1803181 RepID=UPI000C9F5A82|nr:hypothetical protein [Salinibacter altiplanensis]